jgi:pimeloyl-ACP methyl ester carboxylesterase
LRHRFQSLACAAILATTLTAQASAAGPYQVTATVETRIGPLVRTESTVQAGPHALDRFKMIRVSRQGQPEPRGVILFLPPLGTTFAFYEQRDPNGALGTAISEFFALRGYDVWGYSPRFEGIPAGTCEAGVLDCSVMRTWDLASMVEDVAFVRSQIQLGQHSDKHGTKVVTGGASLGGILAVAVANAHPEDFDGIILWEGILHTTDPAVRALNQGYCAADEAQLAAGAVYDGVGGNVFSMVVKLSHQTPGGLTPIPLFPPNFTNHQVLVALLSTPTPGPITMPAPGYIQMNGSLAEDRLFFADERRIYENVAGRFVAYAPTVVARDVNCSLAGTDTTHVSNLGNYHGAVLAIGGGRGFGPYMDDQLAQIGSADATLIVTPQFGHIDHFMTARHRWYVERPILRWLEGLSE